MNKWNKRLILLLILALTMGISVGCSNPKTPEGFTQEFYDDVIKTCNDLTKEVKNIKKEDVIGETLVKFNSYTEFLEKYHDVEKNGDLSIAENTAFDLLTGIVFEVREDLQSYYEKDHYSFPGERTLKEIEKLSNILEIETKLNELSK